MRCCVYELLLICGIVLLDLAVRVPVVVVVEVVHVRNG
jgi:hypothetical protein